MPTFEPPLQLRKVRCTLLLNIIPRMPTGITRTCPLINTLHLNRRNGNNIIRYHFNK